MTDNPENINKKIMSPRQFRNDPYFYTLLILLSCCWVLSFILQFHHAHSDFKSQPDTNTKFQFLIDTNPQSINNSPFVTSKLILILLAAFGALQTFPVLFASHKAKKKQLNQKQTKEIIFLCEMPMYLGLLGSLLGVCLTQFMTGTLTAPLAYISTITGILLHLFAKFTIIVPLPEVSTSGVIEEV